MTAPIRWFTLCLILSVSLVLPGSPVLAATSTPEPALPGAGVSLRDSTGWQPEAVPLMVDPNPIPNRVEPIRAAALSPQSTSFVIDYVPAGSKNGLGDTCLAYPEQAKVAFNDAGAKWGALLNSTVPVRIEACWTDLPQYVLGHSSALGYYRDFSGAPQAGTYYPSALANALSGQDLDPASKCALASNCDDISIAYANAYLSSFYFGTDGNTQGRTDFESVVMHEMGHGLGFAGSMRAIATGSGYTGDHAANPYIYDSFAVNISGVSLLNASVYPRGGTALGSVLVSGSVFLNGTNARAANGNVPVPLYAPATWSGGSSYSHLAESYNGTVNAMMTYSIGNNEVLHDPGPVVLGFLKDEGWGTPSAALPAAPTNLSAAAVSTSQIALKWTDNSSSETSFSLQRAGSDLNWAYLGEAAAVAGFGGSGSYTSSGLVEGTAYNYRMCASNGSACSSFSNPASAATLLAAPTLLSVTPVAWNRIDVSRNDNSTHETGYEIQRSPNGVDSWVTITTETAGAGASTGTHSYKDTSGVAGKVAYRVRAVNLFSSSSWLNGPSANPVPPPLRFFVPLLRN